MSSYYYRRIQRERIEEEKKKEKESYLTKKYKEVNAVKGRRTK